MAIRYGSGEMCEPLDQKWRRLWRIYVDRIARVEDLVADQKKSHQLRHASKAMRDAKKRLITEFPETRKYLSDI